MAEAICLLTCWHLLLFRHFYFINPYHYACSEALEQTFPSWLHLGRCLRGRQWVVDPYYYADYSALPFLSTFYPPHAVTAWLATFLSLNQAWVLFTLTMVLHFYLCSVSVYILVLNMGHAPVVAGLASLLLSSMPYTMKQNSSIIYTTAWVPIYLLAASAQGIWLSGISLGMVLLAGYWPIALYTIPIGWILWISS